MLGNSLMDRIGHDVFIPVSLQTYRGTQPPHNTLTMSMRMASITIQAIRLMRLVRLYYDCMTFKTKIMINWILLEVFRYVTFVLRYNDIQVLILTQ